MKRINTMYFNQFFSQKLKCINFKIQVQGTTQVANRKWEPVHHGLQFMEQRMQLEDTQPQVCLRSWIRARGEAWPGHSEYSISVVKQIQSCVENVISDPVQWELTLGNRFLLGTGRQVHAALWQGIASIALAENQREMRTLLLHPLQDTTFTFQLPSSTVRNRRWGAAKRRWDLHLKS